MSQEYMDSELHEDSRVTFDFKGYLFKVLNLWKFVLVCVGLALLVAYFINVRKPSVYKLSSVISVENDQNPFFTANTSISFNWGGGSGKVGKAITTLKTRTHNEILVDSLEYYVNYFKEGRFDKVEVYKQTPFRVVLDKSKPQVLNMFLGIRILDTNTFEVFFDNPSAATATGQRYDTKTKLPVSLPTGLFTQKFTFGEPVNLPFLHVTLETVPGKNLQPGAEFFIQFLNFDSVVNTYQKGIIVEPYSNNSSSVL